ncbi:MAG: hypothetical protein QXQ18_00505 [Candidatus Aenigmatarchaeota archaeon]
MICPKCKKPELKFLPWLGLIYECQNCGYRGPLKVEKENKKKYEN